jgi:hypothetical protein
MERQAMMTLAITGFLALFGGVVKYLNTLGKKKFSLYPFIISLITALFAGIVVGLFAVENGWPQTYTALAGALGGFSGNVCVELLIGKFFGKIDTTVQK